MSYSSPRKLKEKSISFTIMDQSEAEINNIEHNYGGRNIVTITNYDYHELVNDNEVSDSESCVTDLSEEEDYPSKGLNVVDNLIRLDEKHVVYDVIGQKFMSNFGSLLQNVKIVAIHKKNWSNLPLEKAMLQYFTMLSQTSPKENVKYGWIGGSKQQISKIMAHGFDPSLNSSLHSLVQCVQNCVLDDEGLRHVVLCRVILGDCTKLAKGDSEKYGDGIDEGVISNKYVPQGNKMSTHIWPEYVVSFEAPSYLEGISKKGESMKKPTSPWMSFPKLISVLAKSLPPCEISLIQKHYKQFIQDRVITRRDFIKKMRDLVGDELLMGIIKSNEMKRLSRKMKE